MIIQLPNGLMDGQDLFNYAEIDELRGKQQNYLADKQLLEKYIGHVPKVLSDMILSLQKENGMQWKGNIEEAVWKLPSGDLETIMIKVRENTYGPRFIHEAECEKCGHTNKDLKLDLSSLELDPMDPVELASPKKVMLPKQEEEVELKPVYLQDLFKMIEVTEKKSDSIVTSLLTVSVGKIGEKSDLKPEDFDDIRASDLKYLQNQIKDMKLEGNIDTFSEFSCSKCGEENKSKINVFDPNFLVPTEESTT